jgi:hypothetical protein
MELKHARRRLTPSMVGKLQPCDHLLQIYGHEQRLLELLEWFVGQGLRDDGAVIVIATPRHLHDLEIDLRALWIPVDKARWQGRYIPLLATEALDKVLVNDWPDETRFNAFMDKYVERAQAEWPSLRAFGEMMALLMQRGARAATIRLEQIWTTYCNRQGLPVLCAYHDPLFADDAQNSMRAVAAQHSRVLTEQH